MAKKSKNTTPILAHQNPNFIEKRAGRTVRVLAEFESPREQFNKYNVDHTIAFFGSARTLATRDVNSQLNKLKKANKTKTKEYKRLEGLKKVARYYDECRELAKRISIWSEKQKENYCIVTGGGPGIMEAGNRGAHDAKAPNIGLNIELPFEQSPNPYITPELNLNFNYFFIRKYWFLYLAKALVAFPGGFGTIDELFETLTLIQTKKIIKPIPIILYGKEFWDQLINIDFLAETAMINTEDLDLFHVVDSVDEAFDIITSQITKNAKEMKKMMENDDLPINLYGKGN
ncbi:MAG: LOG family protein [Fibrobacterales bacterium]